jgi:hypothetical protein
MNIFILLSIWGYFNGTIFTVLAFLCVISHLKASFSNPGYASILDSEEVIRYIYF